MAQPLTDLERYQRHIRRQLQSLAPIFGNAAIGDFSGQVKLPEEENELTEFFVGVQIILDTIREKVGELETSLAKLQAANDIIASEKARVEAILESMGEGLVTVDESWHTTYINEPAINLLGQHSRVVGQDATQVLRLEDADGNPVPESKHPVARAIGSRRRISVDLTKRPAYYVRATGTQRRRLGFTITPIIRERKIAGAAIVLRDMTDEANMDRAKSEIISIASHQLRTPLTAIRWYATSLLKDEEDLSPNQRIEYLQRIHDANQHMIQLVDDLLNVSRIDLGTLTLEPRPTSLHATLDAVLKELAVEIAGKKLQIMENSNSHLYPVVVDPNSLHIILQNLISNAVKYSNEGGQVHITLQQQTHNALIAVKDHGVGIPAEQQVKIFSKLFRASNAQRVAVDGSGLGLYVTKAMVERTGGRIWFDSVEGQGSTFYITLPSKIDEKEEG
ncbi:MAG TPA: ATP-binding protein [Candidatus Saccharimonadales bacterium]|nr:ATP-binding protein [Candidatus Saccharimonadales bacterium]